MKIFTILFAIMFGTVLLAGGFFAALLAGAGVLACSAIAWDRGNDSNKAIGRRGGL